MKLTSPILSPSSKNSLLLLFYLMNREKVILLDLKFHLIDHQARVILSQGGHMLLKLPPEEDIGRVLYVVGRGRTGPLFQRGL